MQDKRRLKLKNYRYQIVTIYWVNLICIGQFCWLIVLLFNTPVSKSYIFRELVYVINLIVCAATGAVHSKYGCRHKGVLVILWFVRYSLVSNSLFAECLQRCPCILNAIMVGMFPSMFVIWCSLLKVNRECDCDWGITSEILSDWSNSEPFPIFIAFVHNFTMLCSVIFPQKRAVQLYKFIMLATSYCDFLTH